MTTQSGRCRIGLFTLRCSTAYSRAAPTPEYLVCHEKNRELKRVSGTSWARVADTTCRYCFTRRPPFDPGDPRPVHCFSGSFGSVFTVWKMARGQGRGRCWKLPDHRGEPCWLCSWRRRHLRAGSWGCGTGWPENPSTQTPWTAPADEFTSISPYIYNTALRSSIIYGDCCLLPWDSGLWLAPRTNKGTS